MMKPLKQTFEGRGETRGDIFTQIATDGKAYIYERKNIRTGYTHYEVFLHKENTRFATVSYPGSQAFGVWAWSVPSLELANKKLEEL